MRWKDGVRKISIFADGVAIHKTGIPSDWGHFLEGLTQKSHNLWLLFQLTVFPLGNLFLKIQKICALCEWATTITAMGSPFIKRESLQIGAIF